MNLPIIGDGLHHMWDIRLVLDMFLAGAGAGAFLLAVLVSFYLGWDRSVYLRRIAAIFGAVAMAVSLLLLLSELTQPGRAFLPFISGRVDSPLMWGSWIQLLFMLTTAAYAIFSLGWLKLTGPIEKALAIAGMILAIMVIFYHGVYLADNFARPLWSMASLPLLFAIAALASGAAVLVIASALGGDSAKGVPNRPIASIMVWSGLAVLIIAALYLGTLVTTGSEAEAASQLLISGEFALAVWLGIFAVGTVGVIAAYYGVRQMGASGEAAAAPLGAVAIVGALLVLVSVFVLRYVIVTGGQTLPVLPIS